MQKPLKIAKTATNKKMLKPLKSAKIAKKYQNGGKDGGGGVGGGGWPMRDRDPLMWSEGQWEAWKKLI